MRPLSVGAAILLGLPLSRALNVIVEEDDPSLVYLPSLEAWSVASGPQPGPPHGELMTGYFHSGGCRFYASAGGSISLTFNGSYIAYYSDLFYAHGEMEINLDGVKTSITTYSPLSYGTPQVKLFEAHVDPNTPGHILKLTNLENKTTGFDYILYTIAFPVSTSPNLPGSESSSPTDARTPDPSKQANTDNRPAARGSRLSGIGIVLVAVFATLSVLATAFAGAVWLRGRRRGGDGVNENRPPSLRRLPPTSNFSDRTTPFILQPGHNTASDKLVSVEPIPATAFDASSAAATPSTSVTRNEHRDIPPPYPESRAAR